MDTKKQSEVMGLILQAVQKASADGPARAARELNDALWKLREWPMYEWLWLEKANSKKVVDWAEGMTDATEFLEAVIGNVVLDIPGAVWHRWLEKHSIDSCLAHCCPDMDVLLALSPTYSEAAVNYAAGLYAREGYSVQDFDAFLVAKQDKPELLKTIVLALRRVKPQSPEKQAIHARYLAALPPRKARKGDLKGQSNGT